MPPATYMTLNLRYALKPDGRDGLLAEIETILARCAQEPEFVTAFLQSTPERPEELLLFEIWRGTRDEFLRVQGPKTYRQEYLTRSKQYVAAVDVTFSSVQREWGSVLLTDAL